MQHVKVLLSLLFLCHLAAAQSTLYPIEKKGKWGYMNQEGNIVLPFQYDYADEFSNGYAVVAVRNLPCLIDLTGKHIIDTGIYQLLGRFADGLLPAKTFDGSFLYINVQGKRVITLPSDIYEARKFSNGVAVVAKQQDMHETKFGRDVSTMGYLFAFIDSEGNFITEFIFDDADDMINNLARVRQGTKFGLINHKGAWVCKPAYGNIGSFSEDKAVVDVNGKYGFINTKGDVTIKPMFDYAYNFSNGLAGVWVKGKYGFIDASGTYRIKPQYEQIMPFAEGKAAIRKDGKWGFINTNGELILRNVFDNATVFSEGKCAVLVKKYWGFIDATGALIIPAEYDAVGSFFNGIADVVYRDLPLYVNDRGRLLPIMDKK